MPRQKTGGRTAGTPNKPLVNIREMAARYSGLAIETLVNIAQRSKNEGNRLNAANALLDRAHGKPSQSVANADNQPFKIVVEWDDHGSGQSS